MKLDDLKSLRRDLGLTQAELAKLAGISIPLIQILERGEGNPSLETLERLGRVLGFDVQFADRPANWDLLVKAGLPLTAEAESPAHLQIWDLVREFRLALKQSTQQREREALNALLLALKTHYPSLYERHFVRHGLAIDLVQVDGRLIKLARIARDRLSRWL